MFTQGLLNIMLLSNLKDRIVRRHPGTLRIPALTEVTASRTSFKNAIKGVAAQSIFTPFNFFFFFPHLLFHLCSAFAVFGQAECGELYVSVLVCVCVRADTCVCEAQR